MARIVICGYMIRHPLAGNLLAYFQHILGFHRLGHEVVYVEESGGWLNSCYNPATLDVGDDPRPGIEIVRKLSAAHGLDLPIYYVNRESGKVEGETWQQLKEILSDADLLLNIGGICWLSEFELCSRRAMIDMDPFFSQVAAFGKGILEKHHVHFSYGANIGKPNCKIPSAGVEWLPTVPPVIPEIWQDAAPKANAPFTTIANWNAYESVTFEGQIYGQKGEEFLRLVDLPRHTSQRLELALGGGHDVRSKLQAAGWLVRDAGEISTEVPAYENYIMSSRGEFSAAKNGYVKSHSGWFSDRSACYLAAGLPVVLQDTGFSDWLPSGRGLLAFSSLEEAANALEETNRNYERHRQAAAELASRFFDFKVVLPALLKSATGGHA